MKTTARLVGAIIRSQHKVSHKPNNRNGLTHWGKLETTMHTKFISAKPDRVSSGLLVIFALDAEEKKQTKPVIKLLTSSGPVIESDRQQS